MSKPNFGNDNRRIRRNKRIIKKQYALEAKKNLIIIAVKNGNVGILFHRIDTDNMFNKKE